MKLPDPREDPLWIRIRAHDVEELWDPAVAPDVAATYLARMTLLTDVAARLAGPSGRVLGVGCAQGNLGLMLSERGLSVDLLDVRATSIEYARARHEHGQVTFHVGLIGDDCPPAKDFELVICTEVIDHVPVPPDLLQALKRKTKRGGALLLTTPNADYVFAWLPSFGGADQTVIDWAEPNSSDEDAHCYHRLAFATSKKMSKTPPTIPDRLRRRLCSSQYLVARAS